MPLRFLLAGGAVFLAGVTLLSAESPAVNTPPGPVQPSTVTNAAPETPAPPQTNARSATGAASPNGANGLNLAGKPITKAPNTPTTPPSTDAAPAPAPATATTAKPGTAKPKASVLDNYLGELTDTLKLTADQKTDIQSAYTADGPKLQQILNDASLSPLQQDGQVADLRAQRNDKIDRLLEDIEKQHEFADIEARYRVALTEAAANGGLIAAAAPAPAPAAK